MRKSNDVDDTMNDVVMVIDHQQKRSLILYNIRSRYIYIQFVLRLQAGYDSFFWDAPSLYEYQYNLQSHFYRLPSLYLVPGSDSRSDTFGYRGLTGYE